MSHKKKTAFVKPERLLEKTDDIAREIESKAFDLFRSRNGEAGSELEDWLRAEREVLRPVPVEIRETDDKVIVTAAVPGFKLDDIKVSVRHDQLVLSGETESRKERKEENVVMREWMGDRFFRRLTLPAAIKEENAEASMDHGMLELILRKAADQVAKKTAAASA